MEQQKSRTVQFRIDNMIFEYDDSKNQRNIAKHGISFESAALVFLDRQRIEIYDDRHSLADEDRFTTIGVARTLDPRSNQVLFVVYTEKTFIIEETGKKTEVTRLISARKATNFERGLYYGKYNSYQ